MVTGSQACQNLSLKWIGSSSIITVFYSPARAKEVVCTLILFALSYMGLVESSKNNMEQIFGLSSLGYKFVCLVLT